jgi:hypothetical protein
VSNQSHVLRDRHARRGDGRTALDLDEPVRHTGFRFALGLVGALRLAAPARRLVHHIHAHAPTDRAVLADFFEDTSFGH